MSRDLAFDVLLPMLQLCEQETLWVADESCLDTVMAVAPSSRLRIVSNRFDVVNVAHKAGHTAVFSDFDFQLYESGCFRRIIYRVSKEKPVVHHVLNHAWRLLAPGGELLIAGLKAEGTKTYIEKCRQLFGSGSIEKSGPVYTGCFYKNASHCNLDLLDDKHYAKVRLVRTPELDFYSKPGLFGWDRIDQGSAFLVSLLPDFLAQLPKQPQSLLDLGCGYGYLTIATLRWPFMRRVATDNNAAALLAMQVNASHLDFELDVVADDAGSSLHEFFDLILCNPPFHLGFSIDGDLTDKFLRSAARLLSQGGLAVFVVNIFIPLEQQAARYFANVKVLANNRSFKLIMLQSALCVPIKKP